MKRILLLSSSIIVLGICFFLLILRNRNTVSVWVTEIPQFICGTKSYTEEDSIGRTLFNANCAACHKLDKKMTGPALRDIHKKYDSITIQNYLRGKKTAIQSKGYNSSCLIFRTLSDKEISNILSYTK